MDRARDSRKKGRYTLLLFPVALALMFLFFFLFRVPARADGTVIHVVRYGQNLSSIAAYYGTSVRAIMRANGIRNPNRIYVGQRLRIPVSSRSSRYGQRVHVVRRGETLSGIAARYGVSMWALMRANGLRSANRIYAGQRLVIPSGGGRYASTPSRSTGKRVHVVRWGETLSGIAARYGVSVRALMRANGLRSANRIYAGQRLVIPSRGGGGKPVAAPAPAPASRGKWIEIDISQQRLTAYVGRTPVFSTLVSTGVPRTPTVIGRFAIRYKLPRQHMRGPGYSLPNVPWVMYFYRNYAIHGTYWHNAFGRPMSHGCVNMRVRDARWLYYWAPVGTPVVVRP